MSNSGIIDEIIQTPTADSPCHLATPTEDKKQKNPYGGIDPLELAYLMIFESVKIDRDTAQIQAKGVQNNALIQDRLIGEESQNNFATLTWNQLFTEQHIISTSRGLYTKIVPKQVAQKTLDELEAKNQEVSAVRGVLEDQLIVLRQNAQVQETSLNTVMDTSEQSVQQGASLMQMLTSLTQQISRI